MRNAVVNTALGFVKRWGNADFATDGTFDPATETQSALNDGTIPVNGIPLIHNKVVGGNFVTQTAPEIAATDAFIAAQEQQEAFGAVKINRVVANIAALPLPPPDSGLLVGVINTGGGIPGMALSTGTGWAIFISDSVVT